MTERARIAVPSGLRNVKVLIEDGVFSSIEETDESGKFLMQSGFVDIHTHGAGNIDVNHITSYEEVNQLSRIYASHGVTSFLLSVMTDEEEKMLKIISTLASAYRKGCDGATFAGIHLEGPFLCAEYKGAMPERLIRKADWNLFSKFYDASGGAVKYITVAPESEGMTDFIKKIKQETGVVVAMGHSAAEYETAVKAVECGVSAATHLFNAMKLFHMHRPAISGASLERDEVYCEVICDGFHLHPATVRLILKTKGVDKVVAVTDSIMAAGLPAGRYKLGVNDVIVTEDGDARLPDGVRAGSTLTMDKAYRNLIRFASLSPYELSKVMSENQCRLLHMDDRGSVEQGKRADYVLLDENNEVVRTVVCGRTVYEKGGR